MVRDLSVWQAAVIRYVVVEGKYQCQQTYTQTYCNAGKNNKAVKLPVALHAIKGHSRSFFRITKASYHTFLCVNRIQSIRALLAAAYLYVSSDVRLYFKRKI